MAMMAKTVVAFLMVLAMVCCVQAQCPSVNTYLPCRPAVTTGAAPTGQCCAVIKNVLAQPNGPQCLCDAMTSPLATTIGIKITFAVQLPAKCHLTYIHNYNCKGTIVP